MTRTNVIALLSRGKGTLEKSKTMFLINQANQISWNYSGIRVV
jgi:hypothetical protein